MKIKIVLSTGKEIELTPEEMNELFSARSVIPYMPFIQSAPIEWPDYTITCSGTSGGRL